MGKRQLGEMQPYELVVTLIIADLACIPMSDVSIPLFYGLVAMLAIFLIHSVLVLLSKKNLVLRETFSGKPIVVITPSGIDLEKLNELNMTISDLEESLRGAGYFSFAEVKYGVLETNGKLSVKPYDEDKKCTTFPRTVVSVGKIDKGTLYSLPNAFELLDYFEREKIRIPDLVVLTVDEEGELYIQYKNERFYTARL